MVQGTGSDVGKSLLVAGLCRLFARRGLRVKPFKSQNMSNNAAATADGGEIGRAQALQARAAGVSPSVHMNPVLLKPQSETGAQVVVQGRLFATSAARDYAALKPLLMRPVLESFAVLSQDADLIIAEGAGSPAESNLREADIANMGFALAAGVPVVLAADISRGGVIANLVGTHAVLDAADRAMVAGFIVNKFRGDVRLFDGGIAEITSRTTWTPLGVVPWFAAAAALPAEDTLALVSGPSGAPTATFIAVVPVSAPRYDRRAIKVVVPRLPHIANFDDCDPLRLEPSVSLTMVPLTEPLPGDADLVLLPGSKSTIADLDALKAAGWDIDLAAHRRRGGQTLGLCGGYQMLGRVVRDPHGHEGPPREASGLGLLDVATELAAPKVTRLSAGTSLLPGADGVAVAGYRIHMGRTEGPDCVRPVVALAEGADGATSADGRVMGTYLHGLFAGDEFRAAFLRGFGVSSGLAYEQTVDRTLDALADHLAEALDIDAILAIAQRRTRR